MTTIGSQFDQLAALIIGKNKIEVEWSFFAQLQQSRGGLPQAVNQALDGVNSVNSGSAQWWSGTSHDAASDMLTSVVSGDDTSLSKFSDQLAQQNAQNQHLGELVGQAKDDMHRIVLSAYDQIGQLGASGASGTGGYGPQAMSVIDNAKKAVDDVVLVLLGQIRGARDSAQETANRFTSGKTGGKEAEGHEQAHDDLLAQGNQLKIAAPEAGHNKDGSAAADTKDNDGRAVAATAHANGKTATAVEGKDKDRDLVAGAKHDNGAQAPNASVSKDKKDANTEPDSSKTTSTTKPDGTPQTNDEALAAARGSDEPDKAGGEPRADTGGSRSDGPSYFGGGNGGAGLPGGPGGGGPGGGGGFGGDHGGFGGGPGNGPGGFGGDHGQGNQGSQVQTPADNRGQNTLFHTTPSAWDHTANPTGAIGETHANPTSGPLTAPQSSTSLSTNPQSGATNSSNTPNSGNPAQPNSAEARQSPHAPQGGSPLAGTPAGAQGPLGQLANAATQAAGPIGNIAGTAASIGGNIAGAATSLGQTAAPPVSSAPGTGGPGFPGSEFKPAPGNVTSTNFAGSSGVGAPTPPPPPQHQAPPPPLPQAPPPNAPLPPNSAAPPAAAPMQNSGGAPTSPMSSAYPMTPYSGGGQAAPSGGRNHRSGGPAPWRADSRHSGPNTINPLNSNHPNQDAIDAITRLLRYVLGSDWSAREGYPPGVRPAYAIAAHADHDEIVHFFFFTNQGRGWVPPGVVVPGSVRLGWETVPATGRGAILGRSDPGLQALRHFEAMSAEHIASGRRYRLIAVATSMEVHDELNTGVLRANDNIVGDAALAAEPRFVDPATCTGSKPAEDTPDLLHRLQTVAPEAHKRLCALLAEKADVSQLAMDLAIDTVEASFAYDRPAFLDVVGALKRNEPVTDSMVEALRDDVLAAVASAEIERNQQESKPLADQKLVKYASDHTRISAGVALLALLEGDEESVLDIAYEHYATNARPDKIIRFIDRVAPSEPATS